MRLNVEMKNEIYILLKKGNVIGICIKNLFLLCLLYKLLYPQIQMYICY